MCSSSDGRSRKRPHEDACARVSRPWLAITWRHADPPLARVAAASTVLIALGLLGTFPPFFNAVGG